MKNTLKFFALAAAVAAFASCNEKVEAPVATTEVAPLTISVGTESKTIIRNDKDIQWVYTDTLFVFDNDYKAYRFSNSGDAASQKNFYYENWPVTKAPVFAVYSCSSNALSTTPSFDGDKVTALLYANQKIYNKKSYAKLSGLSVGEISYDGENYSVEKMKNCYSLIQFRVKHSDILSIEVQGTNNEQLGGWVDIDYSKIKPIGEDNHDDPFWTESSDTKSTIIKLDVTGSAGVDYGNKKVFDNSSYYYVALLPQKVQGLSFKVTKADGTEDTQVINGPITLNRSKIKKLAHAVDSALFNAGPGPEPEETFVITFNSAAKARYGNPAVELPTRTTTFTDVSPEAVDFWLQGLEDYVFHGQVAQWGGDLAICPGTKGDNHIKLPNKAGYVLTEVNIIHSRHSSARTFHVSDAVGDDPNHDLGTCTRSSATADDTVTKIDLTNVSASSSERYLYATTTAGANNAEAAIKFILTYTKVSE